MPAHSPKRRDCGGRCSHQLCCSFGQCCTLTMPADFSCVTSPTDPESYHSTTVCSGFPAKKQRRSAARRAICSAVVLTIRSEEHTSELQSLMRSSYAVFCLKKKRNTRNNDDAAKA